MNLEKTFYSLIHKDTVRDLAVSVFVELQFKWNVLHFILNIRLFSFVKNRWSPTRFIFNRNFHPFKIFTHLFFYFLGALQSNSEDNKCLNHFSLRQSMSTCLSCALGLASMNHNISSDRRKKRKKKKSNIKIAAGNAKQHKMSNMSTVMERDTTN